MLEAGQAGLFVPASKCDVTRSWEIPERCTAVLVSENDVGYYETVVGQIGSIMQEAKTRGSDRFFLQATSTWNCVCMMTVTIAMGSTDVIAGKV